MSATSVTSVSIFTLPVAPAAPPVPGVAACEVQILPVVVGARSRRRARRLRAIVIGTSD
jgi:hypothetical protein